MEINALVGNLGCAEEYCAMRIFKAKIRKAKALDKMNGKELYNILEKGEEKIEEIVDEYIQNITIMLSNYVNIFEPEAICIRRRICIL